MCRVFSRRGVYTTHCVGCVGCVVEGMCSMCRLCKYTEQILESLLSSRLLTLPVAGVAKGVRSRAANLFLSQSFGSLYVANPA